MSGSGTNPYPLGAGASPGWVAGYVPPAAEWNMWWSNKIDTDDPYLLGGPFMPLSGGQMTGELKLAGPPLQANDAVTKAYADSLTGAAGPFLPMAGGTMTGLLTLAAAYPPVGPQDAVPKQYADQIQAAANNAQTTANSAVTTANAALPRTGGVMTGYITLPGDPTSPLAASTKQYVDNHFLSLAGGTLTGPLTVGGQGILYSPYSGSHHHAFTWDGTFIQGIVDNVNVGQLANTGWVNGNFPTYSYLAGNYYTATTSNGRFLYKTGDTCTGSLVINGSLNVVSTLYCNTTIHSGGVILADVEVLAGSAGLGLYASGYPTVQFASQWGLVWDPNTGNLAYQNPSWAVWFAYGQVGDFFVHGNVIAANVSDARTKRDVRPIRRGLAEIAQLDPVMFSYNGEGGTADDGRVFYGFTAQDVQPIMPECVYETLDPRHEGMPPTRFPGQLSLDKEPIFCAMVNAFKEVSTRLSKVESQLNAAMKA